MASLYDLAMQYLRQGLPDISGIYPAITTPPPATTDPVDGGDVQPLLPVMPQPSGGDGFSPYDIRPEDSSIRTPDQYNAYPYRQAVESQFYPTETSLQKQMSMYPDYYGVGQKQGIEQLMNKIPSVFGLVSKGLGALAERLPPNETAIFQNELLGQGFKLDNIGRIVTDNYNTPEGIMAGYNPVSGGLLNMLTGGAYGEPTTYGLDKSFDKRTETISNTLKEKYGMSDAEVAAALAGEYKGPVQTSLINRLSLIQQARNKFASAQQAKDIITQRKEEQRAKEEQQRQQQRTREIAEANKAAGDRGGYQSSWGQDRGGGDFMGGRGTPAEMGSF